MTSVRTQATEKVGHCKSCGAKLGLLQRMSKQEFCSPAHRDQYLRAHEQLALASLQDALQAETSAHEESNPPQQPVVLPANTADLMPSDELLGAALAAPAPTEAGPVSAFAEEAAGPPEIFGDRGPDPERGPEPEPDPDEAGFVDFGYCVGSTAAVGVDLELKSTSELLHVMPEPVVPTTRDVSMPRGGSVWNFAPMQSRQPEQLPETHGELPWPAPENAIPRVACAAEAFDWEDAHRAEQARIESEREPEEAGPVPLDPPPLLALSPELVSQTASAGPWQGATRFPAPWLAVASSTTAGRKPQLPSPGESMLPLGGPPAKESRARFHSESATAEQPSALPNLPAPELAIADPQESDPPHASVVFPLTAPRARAVPATMVRFVEADVPDEPVPANPRLAVTTTGAHSIDLAQALAPDATMLPHAIAPGIAHISSAPLSTVAADEETATLAGAPAMSPLTGRTHPRSPCGPPAARKGMRAKLGVRDPGADALLDPFPCPFGGQEEAWQPEL